MSLFPFGDTEAWQHYRSFIHDKVALFFINLDITQLMSPQTRKPRFDKLVELHLPYIPNEEGLPKAEHYDELVKLCLKLIVQIASLKNTFFAGQIYSDGLAKLYFYSKKYKDIVEIATQFDSVREIIKQKDPHCDLYFNYLVPTSREIRINATEELLLHLEQEGKDLTQIYPIEHTFHFVDKSEMHRFMDKVSISSLSLNTINYSQAPISVEGLEGIGVYLVKIQQEQALAGKEIFETVGLLDDLANECSGIYLGWKIEEAEHIVRH